MLRHGTDDGPQFEAQKEKMKVLALVVATCVSLASAGVVITPVFQNQVVPPSPGDCFGGVTTPQGCAYVLNPNTSFRTEVKDMEKEGKLVISLY